MKSATELLEAYVNNIGTPKVSASQFAEDGVLELPWVQAHAQGPDAGVLIAENGKIKLLREELNTVAAAKAFSKD